MKKAIVRFGLCLLVLLFTACSAEKTMTTDWFTLHVPNGITFKEEEFGDMVHELETDTVRYMVRDWDKGIMVWFLKASGDEIKDVYSTYRTVMNKIKLEPTEKKETDTYSIYVYTPVMVNGKSLADGDQYQIFGIYKDGEESWLVSLIAPYSRMIDYKDKFVKMLETIEFTQE